MSASYYTTGNKDRKIVANLEHFSLRLHTNKTEQLSIISSQLPENVLIFDISVFSSNT